MSFPANMRERNAKAGLDEIKDAIREWPRFAAEAGVRYEFADAIDKQLNQ